MAHTHLLSACVFCFLCLAHIHCSEHSAHVIKAKVAEGHDRSSAAAGEPPRHTPTDDATSTSKLFEKFLGNASYFPSLLSSDNPRKRVSSDQRRNKRSIRHKNSAVPLIVEDVYIDKLFKKYQNAANMMDLNGFKSMLESLGLHRFESDEEKSNSSETDHCLEAERLLESAASGTTAGSNGTLSRQGLAKLCPVLLYHLVDPHHCHEEEPEDSLDGRRLITWLYASGSVTIISLCGLFGVFVIPVMGKAFYQQLLQFLVALAVGTLCGDALLHLLPHALVPHGPHSHTHSVAAADDDDHKGTMWKGLAVLLGLIFFFFTEKILMLCSEWRKKQQRSRRVQGHSHVQILNGNHPDSVGEKLCKHKYSSYPYCYPDIKKNMDGHEHGEVAAAGQELLEGGAECGKKAGEYDVIVREHTTSHHGHSHSHGHVHSAPESLSSVAWMVILGDGLHNFTDGMAIGAAFSNNIAGGCSTAVAVFCHELPHELGDFAVLLKTGMSAKQAVFYNLISSVLCFGGMVLGMFIGSEPDASNWVFAVSAGMFLYIALVDMFPEMTTNHSTVETTLCQCCLQGFGMVTGVLVMLVIAYYEDHLLNLFG